VSDSASKEDKDIEALVCDPKRIAAVQAPLNKRIEPASWSVKIRVPSTSSDGGSIELAAAVIGDVKGEIAYNFGWVSAPNVGSTTYVEKGCLSSSPFYTFELDDAGSYMLFVDAVDQSGEVSRASTNFTVKENYRLTRPRIPGPDVETVISVHDVSMIFNIASEQFNSLKEYFIALAHHELKFKEFRALDHISFDVKRGEAFGLVGTNGSGKSTMLKIIAGVLEASEGSCKVVGTIAPLIELGAGFDMELTAKENIYLNGALLGYRKEFIDEHFDDIVNFAELQDFMEMPLKNYSSGMVARIAFAIATITEPDILIVDETLSVGDFLFQKKCEARIKELVQSDNVTVLLVSHSIDLVERMCDRVCWIEKGKQRMLGPTDEVCEAYKSLGQ
jgi:ABC-2 type transport system ATP-binding protein